MASAIYPKAKEQMLQGGIDMATGNVKVTLHDLADYTYSATHEFYSDVAVASEVAESGNLASKTFTDGVFDAADITFTSVSGDQSEALIVRIDTGVDSTSRIIAFIDTFSSGMPVTPNGGNIDVTWDAGANKIFAL
jgi:hypothetical protein